MSEELWVRLLEHNNWANLRLIQACAALTDAQLDAEPRSATKGSLRQTLLHLVSAQQGYLDLLTLPVAARRAAPLAFADLEASARASGEGLLALGHAEAGQPIQSEVETTDGYRVERWVVLVQVINHATEHREQIASLLSALGLTPPDLDGWSYGEVTQALRPLTPVNETKVLD